MKHNKKVHLIIDLQYGSTGKGLIAGYLGEMLEPDVVINANMPNAGHTYINADGREWIHKVLPNAIVSPNLRVVMLGAGSVFSWDRLLEEVKESADLLKGKSIVIHPNAMALKQKHKTKEIAGGMSRSIGSTAQGSGAAMINKIERDPDEDVIIKDTIEHYQMAEMRELGVDIYVARHEQWRNILNQAECVVAEGAQGYSLGINQQFYPYCTSRECTPARFLSDMGIPLPMLKEVIGVARTYPIRVAGTSGDCYPDQEETSWGELGLPEELTTVTKKIRRVFTWSDMQIQDAIWECQPDKVFLNFVNYLPNMEKGIQTMSDVIERAGSRVEWVGVGPTFDDVILKASLKEIKYFEE